MNEHVAPWSGSGSEEVRREPFTFTGTAKEYFGIWIVNVLLTIITLGIYSAWAKVRRLRYFYGNTQLAGASFDYHARPTQILVGRIIVLVLLAAYNIVLNLLPVFGLVLIPLFLLAMPWFIYRGLRFSARVTSYRNVRFDFKGSYGGAFVAYIVGPLLAVVSVGILVPFASRWAWRYQLNNLTYGDRPVTSDPRVGAFYRQWWVPVILLLILTVVVPLAVSVVLAQLGMATETTETGEADILLQALVLMYPLLILAFASYSIIALFYRAGARNVALNATVIDARHRLVSFVGRRRYVWIAVTNVLVTILTLGLARPWAAVRMAKYLAATTALDVSGRLDDFIGSVKDSAGVTGSEFIDFEGVDIGF